MNTTSQPGWNSSTTCLQVLHRNMTEQGWGNWQPATPLCDYEFPRIDFELDFDYKLDSGFELDFELDLELPRRPLDLGVGLWR